MTLKQVFNYNNETGTCTFLNFPMVLFPKMSMFLENVELTSDLTEA